MSLWISPRTCTWPIAAASGIAMRRNCVDVHRLAEQLIERLAAGILEQKRRSIAFAAKRERPRRPRGVERVPQFIFMGKAIED